MFVNTKNYEVNMAAVVISTAITFCEVVAASTKLLILVSFSLGQELSVTSANIVAAIVRKSGAATGGTAFTPIPVQPGQGASSFTAKIQGGTAFSAEGTISDNGPRIPFNALQQCDYPRNGGTEEAFWLAPSGVGSIKFPTAPASATFTLNSVWAELG
jgi:hypothetical protein